MVMITIDHKTWYEDKIWKQNLDIMLDAIKEDDDLLIVFDGKEGAGKSKRLRQVGKYCADYLGTKFNQNNIKLDLQQYIDFSIESPEYTVCVLDEARNQLNRKSSMTNIAKRFTNYLSECRKKKQVHIIALPAYHDLDKYIVMWRMKFLVHVHKWFEEDSNTKSGYKLARGKYTLFMNDQYLKKCYDFPYAYPKRWEGKGVFNNVEVLTDEELKLYDKDKDANIEGRYHSKAIEEDIGKREKMWKARALKLVKALETNRGVKRGELADYMNMEVNSLTKIMSISEI